MKRRIVVHDLGGPLPYEPVLELQRRLARQRIDGRSSEDRLLLVEHEPVLTLGRGARQEHVVAAPERLRAHGIPLVEVERGGDVTYHGPGQLVGYPILDLRGWRRDLHWYVRRLEEALILALAELGLRGRRVEGHTGVWVEGPPRRAAGAGAPSAAQGAEGSLEEEAAARAIAEGRLRKLASIGVHVSRWVTWHGFALNVTPEALGNFGLIVPCGIEAVRMTCVTAESPEAELAGGPGAASSRVRAAVTRGFGVAFGADAVPRPFPPAALQPSSVP